LHRFLNFPMRATLHSHYIPSRSGLTIVIGPGKEKSALLSYYAASSGNSLPAFRDLLVPWRWNQ